MATPRDIRRALYAKLRVSALTNLLGPHAPGYDYSIYHGTAPEGAGFPYVLFHKQSGTPTDALVFGLLGDTLEDEDVWLIKGVDGPGAAPKSKAPSADAAELIADQIKTLLNDGPLTISNGALTYLRRESDVDYGEVIEGVQYRHSGALYRLIWT